MTSGPLLSVADAPWHPFLFGPDELETMISALLEMQRMVQRQPLTAYRGT